MHLEPGGVDGRERADLDFGNRGSQIHGQTNFGGDGFCQTDKLLIVFRIRMDGSLRVSREQGPGWDVLTIGESYGFWNARNIAHSCQTESAIAKATARMRAPVGSRLVVASKQRP